MNTGKQLVRRLAVSESLLLTLAIGAFFNSLFRLRIHIVFLLLFTVIFLSIIYFTDQYRKNLLTYFLLAGIIFVFIITSILLKADYAGEIYKIYKWCLIYNGDEKLYVRSYGLAVAAGIILLCGAGTYVLNHFKKVKNIAAVILTVLLIISAVNKVDIPKITVGIVIFYSLLVLAEYCGKLFYKSSNTVNNSLATVYLAPACLIIALLSVTLPAHAEPIQWKGVKLFLEKAQEQGSILMTRLEYFFDRTGNEFSVSFAGYSEEDSELGGEIDVKKETVLKVSTRNQSTATGYLIGSIRDTYTGRSWERSQGIKDLSETDYYYDFYELLSAFAREEEAGGDLSNLIKKRNYNIEYYDIRTRSLFYPLKTVNINFNQNPHYSETVQGSFLYDRARGIGTKYEVQYYELNLNHELLQKMLREGVGFNYAVSREALSKTAEEVFDYNYEGTDSDMENLKNDLIRRSAEIKARYTALPAALPERVRKLAADLTKGCNNDYDRLKAIEAYLNTLAYTTKVGKTPEGEDFVDYFLFHQRKGYCTYFASAFVVLARCLNISARYVEGFMVDYKNNDGSNTYKVLSSSAHSWAEAYMEGIGWIPFEPTPGFYSARYTPWKDSVKASDSYVSTPVTGQQPAGLPSCQELSGSQDLEELYPPERKNYILPVLGVIVCVLILFIGIIFIYYGILVRKYNNKFKKAPGDKKLSLTMAEILRYLDKEGYHLYAGDTLLIFAKRIGDKIIFNRTNFLDVAEIFMRVRYGEHEVKAEELREVMDFSRYFRFHLQERLGKRRMFFDRFLFLHFYQ